MTAADRDTLAAPRLTKDAMDAALNSMLDNGNARLRAGGSGNRIYPPGLESDLREAITAALPHLDLTERDRRVAAQALRDAADWIAAAGKLSSTWTVAATESWLRDRADTTEGTHHD